jgi:hypothetical protein
MLCVSTMHHATNSHELAAIQSALPHADFPASALMSQKMACPPDSDRYQHHQTVNRSDGADGYHASLTPVSSLKVPSLIACVVS